MKKRFYLLLATLLPCLFACEKELPTLVHSALLAPSNRPVSDCAWTPCEQAIAETKRAYQALANSLCDTVWVEITCCQASEEAFALVFIAPGILCHSKACISLSQINAFF